MHSRIRLFAHYLDESDGKLDYANDGKLLIVHAYDVKLYYVYDGKLHGDDGKRIFDFS